MNRSTPGLPVHHQLPEFTQTHVHRVGDAIQPSHPLSSPSQAEHKWAVLQQTVLYSSFAVQHMRHCNKDVSSLDHTQSPASGHWKYLKIFLFTSGRSTRRAQIKNAGLSTAEGNWKRQDHHPKNTGLAAGKEAQEGIWLLELVYEEMRAPIAGRN